jgi:hypothetical protein
MAAAFSRGWQEKISPITALSSKSSIDEIMLAAASLAAGGNLLCVSVIHVENNLRALDQGSGGSREFEVIFAGGR